MAESGSKRFDQINAIVKRRYETGDYGNAHFRMARDVWEAARASAPPPKPSYGAGCAPGLSHLLAIPVVIDEDLPDDVWRLLDNRSEEILFEGTIADD